MRHPGRFSPFFHLGNQLTQGLVLSPFPVSRRLAMIVIGVGAGLLLIGVHAGAQQAYPYPAYPYGSYRSGYGQYQQQAPVAPYGYVEQPGSQPPQYAEPQYAPPENEPPQYAAPQPYSGPTQPGYAEPAQPGEPYAQPGEPYAQPGEGQNEQGYPTQQPLSAESLEQLVAPIALYPDALLAQILTASTYPAQVAIADQWLHQMQA
jgi:Protein of unknown function (DUF3300)